MTLLAAICVSCWTSCAAHLGAMFAVGGAVGGFVGVAALALVQNRRPAEPVPDDERVLLLWPSLELERAIHELGLEWELTIGGPYGIDRLTTLRTTLRARHDGRHTRGYELSQAQLQRLAVSPADTVQQAAQEMWGDVVAYAKGRAAR